jgi:hypothetical protein
MDYLIYEIEKTFECFIVATSCEIRLVKTIIGM